VASGTLIADMPIGGCRASADMNYMIGFKHILCPTDLTPESDAALRYAVALAALRKTPHSSGVFYQPIYQFIVFSYRC
jgi:hypothetical protein